VLLYNFFADSPVDDGWRVINAYLEKKQAVSNKPLESASVSWNLRKWVSETDHWGVCL